MVRFCQIMLKNSDDELGIRPLDTDFKKGGEGSPSVSHGHLPHYLPHLFISLSHIYPSILPVITT